jgi:hypothetical protein
MWHTTVVVTKYVKTTLTTDLPEKGEQDDQQAARCRSQGRAERETKVVGKLLDKP